MPTTAEIIVGLVILLIFYYVYTALIYYSAMHTVFGVLKYTNWLSDDNNPTPLVYHFDFPDDTNVKITIKNVLSQLEYIITTYSVVDSQNLIINPAADCSQQSTYCSTLPWQMVYSSMTQVIKTQPGSNAQTMLSSA